MSYVYNENSHPNIKQWKPIHQRILSDLSTVASATLGNTSEITTIKDGASIDSFGDVETALDGKIDTAGTGLSKSGTTLNHSNSVTAKTNTNLSGLSYDAQGHVTGNGTEYTVQTSIPSSPTDTQLLTAKATDTALSDKQSKTLDTQLTIDGASRTTVEAALAAYLPMLSSPQMHANIFRGKNLGSSVTEAQWTAISNGTFSDLFVGDYWVISGTTYRIADFNRWKDVSKNHLVIVPDNALYTSAMHDANSVDSGYVGSKMHTEYLQTAKNTINTAFGSTHIVSHKAYYISAVTDGVPTGAQEVTVTVELMGEIDVFGSYFMSQGLFTRDITQLALFRMCPKYIYSDKYFWLRDIKGSNYAMIENGGSYVTRWATYTVNAGVRPYFGICA